LLNVNIVLLLLLHHLAKFIGASISNRASINQHNTQVAKLICWSAAAARPPRGRSNEFHRNSLTIDFRNIEQKPRFCCSWLNRLADLLAGLARAHWKYYDSLEAYG